MSSKRLKAWTGLAAMAVSIGALFAWVEPAAAAPGPYGTTLNVGYFTGGTDFDGRNVIENGVSALDKPSFIAEILGYYNQGATQNGTGAAFIISTMLGRNSPGTRNLSAADIADWQNRVNASNINFNEGYTFCLNSYWQDSINLPAGDDAFFSEGRCFGPADIDFGEVVGNSIVFRDGGGAVVYAIRRACGNPVGIPPGSPTGLPPADYNVSLSATSTPAQGATPPLVAGGDLINVNVSLNNSGPANSAAGALEVMYPGAAVAIAPCGGACGSPGQVPLSGGKSSAQGFRTGSVNTGGGADKNWFWTTVPMGVGGTSGGLTFTIPVNAPLGVFSVTIYYSPANLAGARVQATLLFNVRSKRIPGITAINGDVHAGDGCAQPAVSAANGYILTNPSGASYGQYVVSSSGSRTNFRSNNATPGQDYLSLGRVGGYIQLCRKDLVKEALNNQPVPPNIIPNATSAFNVTGKEGVWYWMGAGELQLSGTVGQTIVAGTPPLPLTIVAPNGSIRITGNILVDQGTQYAARSLPSLGILAQGGIYINPAVSRVDAYMFANGNIYTCDGSNAACSNTLTVNGFLMARDIWFGRLGAFNTNGTAAAETVVLGPQIYLNPPRFFDSAVDGVLLLGQGERTPLF